MDNVTFTPPAIANLKDMLNKSAMLYGEKDAYQIKNSDGTFTHYTYKDVLNMVQGLGTGLINMGLKGQKIAIIGENRIEWEIAYLAIVCGVGIVVPIDKTLPENELKSVIERSEVSAIFYSEKYKDALTRIKFGGQNNLRHLISMDQEKHSGGVYSQKELTEYGNHLIDAGFNEYIDAKINPYTMNIMLFTSGTTSQSKVVALSQYNICSNLLDIDKILDISYEDIFLSFLPLNHVFECTVGFLFPIYKGAKIVILPQSFTDETNKTKVVDSSKAYIFPAGREAIFNIALQGPTQVKEIESNSDWSKELHTYKKFGVAAFVYNDIATYTITNLKSA